jgi:hypothetical protein
MFYEFLQIKPAVSVYVMFDIRVTPRLKLLRSAECSGDQHQHTPSSCRNLIMQQPTCLLSGFFLRLLRLGKSGIVQLYAGPINRLNHNILSHVPVFGDGDDMLQKDLHSHNTTFS